MKLRMLTGLACVLALSGCATYDYVGGGGYDGGYYTGAPRTEYRYYDYGYPYYGYSPGVSLGITYGYPSYGYPVYRYDRYRPYGYAGYPHFHGVPYRPPVRPGGHHGGRPNANAPPHAQPDHDRPRDRAPWRDLERLRREQDARPQRPGPRMDMQTRPTDGQFRGRPGAGNPPPAGIRPSPGNDIRSPDRMPSPEFRPRPASGGAGPAGQGANLRQRQAAAAQPTYERRRVVEPANAPAPVQRSTPVERSAPVERSRPVSAPRPARVAPSAPRSETGRTRER